MPQRTIRRAVTIFTLAALALPLAAQKRYTGVSAEELSEHPPGAPPPIAADATPTQAGSLASPSYRMGSGDELSLWVRDADEINTRGYRVDSEGRIKAPMIGMVEIGGLTVREAEELIESKLEPYFVEPEAAITVTTFRSQPVSVLGAVRQPGMQQIIRDTTLMEAISMAGGLTSSAGYIVRLTRHLSEGEIPFPEATVDPNGKTATVELSTEDLLGGRAESATMLVRPHDIITVPDGELIYVLGQVNRAGGFVLGVKEKVSVMRALAMAEGLSGDAAPKRARILRPSPDSKRHEIEVNLNKIMNDEGEDLLLFAGDILHVPSSNFKKAARVGLTSALTVGTGMAIFRLGR